MTWLMHQLPAGLGLWWFVPLWLVMAGIAVAALVWGSEPGPGAGTAR